jgi:hypothetical protein
LEEPRKEKALISTTCLFYSPHVVQGSSSRLFEEPECKLALPFPTAFPLPPPGCWVLNLEQPGPVLFIDQGASEFIRRGPWSQTVWFWSPSMAVWLGMIHSASVCLSFLICKMGEILTVPAS